MEDRWRTGGGPKGHSDLGLKLDVLNLGEIWCRRAEEERDRRAVRFGGYGTSRALGQQSSTKAWRTTGTGDW